MILTMACITNIYDIDGLMAMRLEELGHPGEIAKLEVSLIRKHKFADSTIFK